MHDASRATTASLHPWGLPCVAFGSSVSAVIDRWEQAARVDLICSRCPPSARPAPGTRFWRLQRRGGAPRTSARPPFATARGRPPRAAPRGARPGRHNGSRADIYTYKPERVIWPCRDQLYRWISLIAYTVGIPRQTCRCTTARRTVQYCTCTRFINGTLYGNICTVRRY